MSSNNVVILGATGYVGTGITFQFLKVQHGGVFGLFPCLQSVQHGFTVVAQSREQTKLDALKATLAGQGADVSKLHFVVGSFQSEAEAKAVGAAVQKLVGVPQHVVSILGFVDIINTPASETTPEALDRNFENSFWPNVRAANVFIPLQKGKVRRVAFRE